MFEEDAEEWANEMYPCDGQAQRYLLMGAEFGYNKANEWHYPSKGEYPIDKTEMLVYFKYADYEYPCKTFGFYNGHFWDTKRGDVSNKEVIAWKEIVLPELPKEN